MGNAEALLFLFPELTFQKYELQGNEAMRLKARMRQQPCIEHSKQRTSHTIGCIDVSMVQFFIVEQVRKSARVHDV